MQADGAVASPSWIAAGLSSGICRLIDVRSGNIISSWRAHDAYVTKDFTSLGLEKVSPLFPCSVVVGSSHLGNASHPAKKSHKGDEKGIWKHLDRKIMRNFRIQIYVHTY